MQLKISCFNKTLFRKNLTRFWPLWGMATFGGSLFPGLEILAPHIEITAFATFCLHEYERSFRMYRTDDVNKLIETLMDDFSGRV